MHALALIAVAGLVLVSAFVAPASGVRSAPRINGGGGPAGEPEPTPPAWMTAGAAFSDIQPAATPTATESSLVARVDSRTGRAQTAAGAARISLPQWVRNTTDTPLWSGPDDDAIIFTTLPTSSYLKPIGPYLGGRLLVYYAGDGGTRAAGQAWIDAQAVEPTSAPAQLQPPVDALALKPLAAPRKLSETSPPGVTARYVAIIDEQSGQLLYGSGEHVQTPPASTTKIATTIVALEQQPNLQQPIDVTVSGAAMAARDGSSVMGLEPGEHVALETLLYGMMLPSGNDAAEQVARSLGGSRQQFVQWMNDKVQALGLKDTHFVTPSGMDASGHYSSAYDMAMLARYAMQNEAFRKMAGAMYFYGDGYSLKNLNRLIGFYDGTDGVKIGYTDLAGKTIIASTTRGGHRVYVSLMHSDDLVTDSVAMFNWVWKSFSW